MSFQPSKEVLERFGVRLLAALGGRLNQHWLVEARGERLVLRRWSQPIEEVDGTRFSRLSLVQLSKG